MQAFKLEAFASSASSEGLSHEALIKAANAGEMIEIEVNDDG